MAAHSFLSLVPIQSDSYPSSTASSTASTPSDKAPEIVSPRMNAVDQELAAVPEKTRRSSSVSSGRFLKLGPIHFGGEPGVSDFADEM